MSKLGKRLIAGAKETVLLIKIKAEEEWLNNTPYTGGMTEWHERRRSRFLKELLEHQLSGFDTHVNT